MEASVQLNTPPGRFIPGKMLTLSTDEEAGWALESVRILWRRAKPLTLNRNVLVTKLVLLNS
jgi:hypothetical protein